MIDEAVIVHFDICTEEELNARIQFLYLQDFTVTLRTDFRTDYPIDVRIVTLTARYMGKTTGMGRSDHVDRTRAALSSMRERHKREREERERA